MRLKTIFFISLLIVLAIFFIKYTVKEKTVEFKPLELEVGDVFAKIEYPNTMYVLNYAIGDVTGDQETDMVIVLGSKETVDSTSAQNVDVVVYDKQKQLFAKAGIKNYEGAFPKVQLSDLTGDGIDDMVVSLENSDKTMNIRMITMMNNGLKEIWTRRDNRGLVFVGEVDDGLKAHLRCGKMSLETDIDLNDCKEDFVSRGKANSSGKILTSDKSVNSTGICSMELVNLYEQKGIMNSQKMVVFSDDIMIDEIQALWKYVDGKWQIVEAKTNRLGVL